MSDIVEGNRSLFIFPEGSRFRQKTRRIEKSKYFKNGILFFIVVSSVALAFENPLEDPDSTQSLVLRVLDICMTTIFATEVAIKVIANGFICNGKKSYMRKFWNVLDFFVVFIAILSQSLPSDSIDL